MPAKNTTLKVKAFESELHSLRRQLEEAKEAIRAIQAGNVDAIVVRGSKGNQLYSLKSADESYRLLVEAMSEGALIASPAGIILYANESMSRFLSTPMKKLTGKPITEFASGEDRNLLVRQMESASRGPAHAELALLDRDGRRLPCKVSIAKMKVGDEGLLSMVVTDLRSRNEVREHVDARRRLSFLLEASRLLTSTLDPQEMLELIARLALNGIADWCAIDLKEDNGRLRRATIVHRDPAKSEWAEAYARRNTWQSDETTAAFQAFITGTAILLTDITAVDVRKRNPKPEVHELVDTLGLASAMVVPMKGRHDTIGVISFLSSDPAHRYGESDLHMAESLGVRAGLALENSKLYKEAQDSVRSREQFLSIASHELRTPLTSLQIGLQHAIRKLRRLPDSDGAKNVLPMAEAAEMQSLILVNLLNRLLDVSSLRAGKVSLNRESFNLDETIRAVVDRFMPELKHSATTVRVRSVPVIGSWDKMRIEQVLSNLVSNAIKFGEGKPIEISLEQADRKARITIRDFGIGMEPEFLQRIFKPFEQAKSGTGFRGLGLGLYIVQQLVEAHGGSIRVESTPGVETTFTVELPIE